MSWFPERMSGDGPVEVEEGVLLERRGVLMLSAGALALLSLKWPQQALGDESATDDDADLSWDALVRKAVPLAERLVNAKKPNEELYIARLAALVHRLKIPSESEALRAKRPLVVTQFRFQPGKGFAWHDHRDYNGLILCVAGEARIRSAEVLGGKPRLPKGKTFEIRETTDALLTAGSVSRLTRSKDNLHDLRGAGEDGARVLDFFTFFEPGGRSVYLNVEEKPKDAQRRVYEAAWTE
jgi:hypothetical protein